MPNSLATTTHGPLGCGTYVVRLVNDGAPILAPRKVTSVVWNRRKDRDVSSATVTIPVEGTDQKACCEGVQKIEALRTEAIITRDGIDVWQGWVLNDVSIHRDNIIINASDILGWTERRVLDQNHTDVNVDLTNIALGYIGDINSSADLPFVISSTLTGILAKRTVLAAEYRFASDALGDLYDSGLDATVVAGIVLLGPETQICGTLRLRDTDIDGDPEIKTDGRLRATRVIVKGGNGIVSIRPTVPPTVCFHGADIVHDDESILDQNSADAAATLLYDQVSSSYPYFLQIGEGSTLRPTAPVHINALIPGAIFQFYSQALCVKIAMAMRLVAVDVEAAAGTEQVRVTFEPLGSSEETFA